MLKGTFGLAKNTEQRFEAREVLRRDLVKTQASRCKCVWEPGGCLAAALSVHLHLSQSVLSLTAEPGTGPARQERTAMSRN